MSLNWIRDRRRSKAAVVERKKVVNPDTGETPEGYNKMLRDCARIALAGASAALLGGWPQIALVASAIAAGLLQQGSRLSVRATSITVTTSHQCVGVTVPTQARPTP